MANDGTLGARDTPGLALYQRAPGARAHHERPQVRTLMILMTHGELTNFRMKYNVHYVK